MTKRSRFSAEREAFEQLKHAVDNDPELRKDIEIALQQLLGRYSTSIRENRFIVGGALEVILTAALRAAGVQAEDVGVSEQRIDIRIHNNGGFSIKGHFKGKTNIRLINVLGDSPQTEWDTATIFVLHNVGIGYADPELLPDATERAADALVMKYTDLQNFLKNNRNFLIECSVPSALQNPSESELVSRVVAREILKGTKKLVEYIP